MTAPRPDPPVEPARCAAKLDMSHPELDEYLVASCDNREPDHVSHTNKRYGAKWSVDPVEPNPEPTGTPVPSVSEVRADIENVVFEIVEHIDVAEKVVDALAAAGHLHLGPVVPDDPDVLRQMLEEAKGSGECERHRAQRSALADEVVRLSGMADARDAELTRLRAALAENVDHVDAVAVTLFADETSGASWDDALQSTRNRYRRLSRLALGAVDDYRVALADAEDGAS